jgi:nanoRNase/pAp phosphatase (c-di-AMP/oligoRNAs hydrolase)
MDRLLESPYASEKLKAFLEVCRSGKPLYIMTHDHPDPDAMASAAGLQFLIKHTLERKSRIVYSGQVERPENRAMKAYLRTTLSHLPNKLFERDITLILVDTQPGAGNHPLPTSFKPAAVLDHHPLRRITRNCPFWDVRPSLGACATLVAAYLHDADLSLPTTLATALCYAITSETRDLGREASEQDIETYVRLLKSANLRRLSRIEHSRAPREYFLTLHDAIKNAFVYKDIIGACLGRVSRPDLGAQIADLLLTHEGMRWSICSGAHKNRLYISIRTTRQKARCGMLLRRILGKEGSAGGHGMIAGGYLSLSQTKEEDVPELEKKTMLRFIRNHYPPGIEELPYLMGPSDS